jgi:uncharacterized protein YciI
MRLVQLTQTHGVPIAVNADHVTHLEEFGEKGGNCSVFLVSGKILQIKGDLLSVARAIAKTIDG